VRKWDTERDPVLVQRDEPDIPPVMPAAVSLKPADPASTPLEETLLKEEAPPAQAASRPEAKRPVLEQAAATAPATAAQQASPQPKEETAKEESPLSEQPKPAEEKLDERVRRRQSTRQVQPGLSGRPAIFSFAAGGLIVLLALCFVCVGAGGWFVFQSEAGTNLIASLGFVEPEATGALDEELVEATGEADVPLVVEPVSPVVEVRLITGTPTLPPTHTPTSLPPTNTLIPTETPTPAPEPPTGTPTPTDTPTPTETPTPEPTEEPPPPEEVSEPAPAPTPGFKYGAPALLGPEDEFKFIGKAEIIFRWAPVENLAVDEQYAVRVRYQHNGQITYQGAQVKEPQWVMPLSLYGQIDPPLHHYEWFVVVERLNDDGSGTAISPQSQVRSFIWD
jgi:hypothetical protein